ncbi:MAG: 2,3,4,5-tetrahydropyridine-2,6-dicarboxylate N-succinyltransferase [Halobacteriovoraceae bacterium]|nr:2,3,4,5-tetrahydropyridine-2,6-dicarboxylate N-succinyltransferase [Halobacteriovoraceae bacterium]
MNWRETLDGLEKGAIRAAYKKGQNWHADKTVKNAILEAFKEGELRNMQGFVDKDNLAPRSFDSSQGIRVVPGGTAVRRGAHVAKGVIIMPPSYVNIGAFVDEDTMVDSHVLVGSCAQIGKRVHLSAGAQIGGVLEPVGQTPVIIEDDAFIGAGAVIVEGILIRKNAVIAPGVVLSKSIPVFDCVAQRILEKEEGICENAVVVPGSRPAKSTWAKEFHLQMNCALIVKYRDSQSDASLLLESVLR